jgi:hypothetical protein
MSPTATRFFKLGLALSIIVGMASMCGAVWAVTRSSVTILSDEGLPIGNRRLSAYRRGADLRITTSEKMTVEVFLSPPASPDAIRKARAWNEAWGHPQHWLNVPAFSLSLWWPLALSGVLPGVWLARRRRRHAVVGFPIVASPRVT